MRRFDFLKRTADRSAKRSQIKILGRRDRAKTNVMGFYPADSFFAGVKRGSTMTCANIQDSLFGSD
jgi:hypothetical protein